MLSLRKEKGDVEADWDFLCDAAVASLGIDEDVLAAIARLSGRLRGVDWVPTPLDEVVPGAPVVVVST